jgi:phosphoglycerol transferase MdoB-like AlkP superfamily enzyme
MDLNTTLILGGMTLALALFCGWRGARKPDPHKGVRLIPWRPLMVFSFMAFLLLLSHLVHINDS